MKSTRQTCAPAKTAARQDTQDYPLHDKDIQGSHTRCDRRAFGEPPGVLIVLISKLENSEPTVHSSENLKYVGQRSVATKV